MVYENMTQKKVRWKCIISCCYRTEIPLLEESEDPVLKLSSCRRLSLSDLSNPSSPLYVQDLSNSFLGSNLHVFTFTELRVITREFLRSNLLGEGGFGPVYKGFIDDKVRPGLEAQPVAVKSLDLEGVQGHREWMAEIVFLGQLMHPHLVKLIGYCCEEDQRLLVYEYMPRGSLENQLFRRYSASLKWSIRMKIALGAAKGLAFLHEADPPVIYRDFKTSNILLDSDFTAKLSDFGLAKDGPEGEETHVTTRVMGTQGYAAPEYIKTGHLTTMSDVYSFGVVLLELLTGQRSMDHTRPRRAQSLVDSARPHLKDPNKLDRIIDPRLDGEFQGDAALKAAALAYKCLNYHPKTRPSMSYVVNILESLQDQDCGDILAEPIVYLVGEENGGEECFGREEGIKSEGQKDSSTESIPQNHKRHRHHGWRNRIKLPNPVVSFSDTTLYEGFPNGLNSPDAGKRRNR